MSLTGSLISQIVGHAFGLSGEKLVTWIEERFADHTQALPKALAHANDCAWHAVGLALCGDSFFDWFKNAFRDRDLKAVRDQIREFLAATPTGLEMSPAGLRVRACEEWHRLRKAGRFSIGDLSGKAIAQQASGIQRFGDTVGLTQRRPIEPWPRLPPRCRPKRPTSPPC